MQDVDPLEIEPGNYGNPNIAGSAAAILSQPDVAEVFGFFAAVRKKCYGDDIRDHRRLLSAPYLRAVRSFVSDYGVGDSLKVIDRLFGPPYYGTFGGQTVDMSIWNKSHRWLADKMLVEASEDPMARQRGGGSAPDDGFSGRSFGRD